MLQGDDVRNVQPEDIEQEMGNGDVPMADAENVQGAANGAAPRYGMIVCLLVHCWEMWCVPQLLGRTLYVVQTYNTCVLLSDSHLRSCLGATEPWHAWWQGQHIRRVACYLHMNKNRFEFISQDIRSNFLGASDFHAPHRQQDNTNKEAPAASEAQAAASGASESKKQKISAAKFAHMKNMLVKRLLEAQDEYYRKQVCTVQYAGLLCYDSERSDLWRLG